LRFADQLFSTGAYLQAATEYLRLRFSTAAPPLRNYAGLMAAESYLKAGEFDWAGYTFQEFAAPEIEEFTRYGIIRTRFAQGRFAEVRPATESLHHAPFVNNGRILASWSLFKELRFAEGAHLLGNQSQDSLLNKLSQMDGSTIPRRSRVVASLLSLFIPGAGQFYSGRAGDGAYAFATIAGTGFATYWFATHPDKDRDHVKLIICASLTTLFHAGNVFGASNAARDYNGYQERRYLASAEELFHQLNLEPNYRPLLDSLETGN